eukprot:gb/GEZN01003464.1/.p1 GENE.gb/GEZN01003464.1/~~gb/GEZN01003464.1/.p1  ORF type:complete len:589 (-),score=148.36 gb/GEZN01003464.1/:371-2137(-)
MAMYTQLKVEGAASRVVGNDFRSAVSIKRMISEREDVPAGQQRLMFNGDGKLDRGDPAWEASVSLAEQLGEEVAHQEELLRAAKRARHASEASVLLAMQLQEEEEDALRKAAQRAKEETEGSLLFAQKLQDEEKQKEAARMTEDKEKEAIRIAEAAELNYRNEEEELEAKEWKALLQKQQFSNDDSEEKIRVEGDKERFHAIQVSRTQKERRKEEEKTSLTRLQENVDRDLTRLLEEGATLQARGQEAERQLAEKQQAQIQAAIQQEQVRAHVRAEAARQEAARLAALAMSRDPNLYLYPSTNMCASSAGGYVPVAVTIELSDEWVFSTAEPEVSFGGAGTRQATWKVGVNSVGKLRDKTGRTVSSIKYDMRDVDSSALLQRFQLRTSNTFCVSKRDHEEFFERAFRRLGLQGQEAADMLDCCRPIVQQTEWTNITFLTEDTYDELVGLSIRPVPHQVIRVFAVLRNVPGWDATAQGRLDALPTPDFRDPSQFLAVEWGAVDASTWDHISSAIRAKVREEAESAQIRELEDYARGDMERREMLMEQNSGLLQQVRAQENGVRQQDKAGKVQQARFAAEIEQFRRQGLY